MTAQLTNSPYPSSNGDGTGGSVPTLSNYVAFNGDISNAQIGFDPHQVMGVTLTNGAIISVGSALNVENENAKGEAIITRMDLCADLADYTTPSGTYVVAAEDELNCAQHFTWSWRTNTASTYEKLNWAALSPDETFILAVGTRDTASNGNTQARWVVKVDVETGSKVWEFDLSNEFGGTRSGYETVAFTADGGFIVGGFGKYEGDTFPPSKSGGQVEAGVPIIEKFSVDIANANSLTNNVLPEWSWACEGTCSTSGSTKSVRVYNEAGIEKVVGVPGVRTSIVVLNAGSGSMLQQKVLDDAEFDGIGTSNDIEVAFDGNTVTGFVTTGLDFSQINCPDGGAECTRVGGHITKISADLESVVWNTRFNNFAGGVGKFASVTDSDLGEAVVLTECWGLTQVAGSFIAACGQGIEGCDAFSGSMRSKCNSDPRRDWRGVAVGVAGDSGEMSWYRADNFDNKEDPVFSSAYEYVMPLNNGFVMVSDELMGFGFATYAFDDAPPPTTNTTTTVETTQTTSGTNQILSHAMPTPLVAVYILFLCVYVQ